MAFPTLRGAGVRYCSDRHSIKTFPETVGSESGMLYLYGDGGPIRGNGF